MKKLLIIEDDAIFAAGLMRSLQRRGYVCALAAQKDDALHLSQTFAPTHVLLDLNLAGESGQDLIPSLRQKLPSASLVVLTGFGTIPSTVRAMKDGADGYLCKPASPEAIDQALQAEREKDKMPLWDLENEHILKVLSECGGNVSQAARELGLHRRTLQRRLKKMPDES